MKTLADIAIFLKNSQELHKVSQKTIMENTGLTSPTIRGLLSAKKDSKLTTLMAVADELDLELILVPKALASSLLGGLSPDVSKMPHPVRTLVSSALNRKENKQ